MVTPPPRFRTMAEAIKSLGETPEDEWPSVVSIACNDYRYHSFRVVAGRDSGLPLTPEAPAERPVLFPVHCDCGCECGTASLEGDIYCYDCLSGHCNN